MALELVQSETIRQGLRELRHIAHSMRENLVARIETPVLEEYMGYPMARQVSNPWHVELASKTMQLYGSKKEEDELAMECVVNHRLYQNENKRRFSFLRALRPTSKLNKLSREFEEALENYEEAVERSKTKEDNRIRFKIDHAFDLSIIVNETIDDRLNGAIKINENIYNQSQGTEFIIIDGREDLEGTKGMYAIRTDKYSAIKDQLGQEGYKVEDLEKAGGFKIRGSLTPKEAEIHDGWLELAVGKNNASPEEYVEASELLKTYVSKVQEGRCFENEGGMAFHLRSFERGYLVLPWNLNDSIHIYTSSDADGGWTGFDSEGLFLKKVSTEAAAQKIKAKTPVMCQ